MTRPWHLGALAKLPHILPASLLFLAEHMAGPALDPLAYLGGVPHPSVGRGLLERLPEFLLLLLGKQRPFSGTRILMTTVSQSLRARGVVTTSYLLDPSPGVSGGLHKLAGSFSFADEPEDLVVAA